MQISNNKNKIVFKGNFEKLCPDINKTMQSQVKLDPEAFNRFSKDLKSGQTPDKSAAKEHLEVFGKAASIIKDEILHEDDPFLRFRCITGKNAQGKISKIAAHFLDLIVN